MTSILILEDDPMVQFIHKSYLEKIDATAEVIVSLNATAAENILAEKEIDLLLLDIHLGQENGLTVLRELRQQNFAGEVILISAATEVHYIKEASHLGILDYLIKPFIFERFQESYLRFLEKQQLLTTDTLPQAKVDALFQAAATKPQVAATHESFELEKGLTEATLGLIFAAMRQFDGAFTILELSEKIGLSHVSVRKYVQFLESQQIVKSETIYRKIGRPYQVFQLIEVTSPFMTYLEGLTKD
ncbi:response regulator [Enterococcus sp. LJL120]